MWLAVAKATGRPTTEASETNRKRELRTATETKTAVGVLVKLKVPYNEETSALLSSNTHRHEALSYTHYKRKPAHVSAVKPQFLIKTELIFPVRRGGTRNTEDIFDFNDTNGASESLIKLDSDLYDCERLTVSNVNSLCMQVKHNEYL